MKITFVPSTPEESLKYLQGKWTPDFAEHPFVKDLTARVARRMPLFCKMDNESLERSNFTTWLGVIAERDYPNPYIGDLYLLHELYHLDTLQYDSSRSWSQFQWEMLSNEFEASLLTEMQIYLEMPTLRPKTFAHEIYVDRYLLINPSKEFWEFTLRELRMKAMRSPHPFDFLEQQIAAYGELNREWCRIWAKSWKGVDQHMEQLNKDLHIPRIMFQHADWINQNSTGADNVPWELEAIQYSKLSRANYLKFGNYLSGG